MAFDIAVIRPEMRVEQVKARGADAGAKDRVALRKALRTLHTLEIMATKIYACQITAKPCVLNTTLTAAMCNEMTHTQDFQTKLYEYGFKPSKLRWAYWVVGYVFGLGSRLLGTRAVLRTGVWVEGKAVRHYAELLDAVEWDADTRAVIEKDQADEAGHIARWEALLRDGGPVC
jgi:demethoxyubiquinone hydroxylase (CLK1/Coq7/Cat5 family)